MVERVQDGDIAYKKQKPTLHRVGCETGDRYEIMGIHR